MHCWVTPMQKQGRQPSELLALKWKWWGRQ